MRRSDLALLNLRWRNRRGQNEAARIHRVCRRWVVGWPLVARAQAAVPVVGVLFGGSAAILKVGLPAFFAGLGELGFVDGRNIAIEIRTGGRRAMNGYPRWPPIWSVAKSM